MGAWYKLYFFPDEFYGLLNAVEFVKALDPKISTSRCARMLVEDAESGLILPGGEVELGVLVRQNLIDRLGKKEQLEVELCMVDTSARVSLTVGVSFATALKYGHIMLGWQCSIFRQCSVVFQDRFWNAMRGFADTCRSGYAICGIELPDDFHMRVSVDDKGLVIDTSYGWQYGHRIEKAWIRKGLQPPDGLEWCKLEEDNGGNFDTYKAIV